MQHPDEGTIHAWLDGELPYEESSRIASHMESCARCAALVAEARGFVAASSRILRQLDDVPGGVVPSTPGSNPVLKPAFEPRDWGVVLPIPRRGAHRRWFPSKFAAAAAITVMAVGAYTVMNRSHAPIATAVNAIADSGESATTPAAERSEALAPAARDAAADQAAAGAAGARSVATVPPAPVPAATTGAAKRLPADTRAAEKVRAPAPGALRPPPSAPVTNALGAGRAKEESVGERLAAKSTVSAQFNDVVSRAGANDSLGAAGNDARQAALTIRPDTVIESERRRLMGEVARGKLSPVVTTGVGNDAPQRLGTNPTVTTAPGCYDLSRGADAVAAGVPASVRLAEAQVRVGNRTLRLAVPQGQEPVPGENWYWSLGGGRIILHKVLDGSVRYEGPVTATRRGC